MAKFVIDVLTETKEALNTHQVAHLAGITPDRAEAELERLKLDGLAQQKPEGWRPTFRAFQRRKGA